MGERSERGAPTGRAMPILTLVFASLAASLPVPAGPWADALGPGLLAGLVFHWSLEAADRLPVGLPFACGLLLDLTSAGPVGFWALLLVLDQAGARLARRMPGADRLPGSVVAHAVVLALGLAPPAALAAASTSGGVGAMVPIWGAAVLTYPALALALGAHTGRAGAHREA